MAVCSHVIFLGRGFPMKSKMKSTLFGVTAFIAASILSLLLSLGIATAAPLSQGVTTDTQVEALDANPHIVKVKGCHSNKKWHMVYKWGKKAWHRHGYNCQPKHVKKKKWKKKKWGHCHRKWHKHWHNGRGSKWHRHAGPNCHYQWGKKHKYYKKNHGCIKIGPVWVCQ